MTPGEFYERLEQVTEAWTIKDVDDYNDIRHRPIRQLRTVETDRCPIHAVLALDQEKYDELAWILMQEVTNDDIEDMASMLGIDADFMDEITIASDCIDEEKYLHRELLLLHTVNKGRRDNDS